MIPLTFLYDEYIDRPKLTEEKNPFEYIVPPPTSGSEQLAKLALKNSMRLVWDMNLLRYYPPPPTKQTSIPRLCIYSSM